MSEGARRRLDYNDVMNDIKGGDESAKTKLAWLKLSGHGGAERDEDGAVKLLEERVPDGDGSAIWMLGVCCEYGMGTEQDIERAEKLYSLSREKGKVIGRFLEWNGKRIKARGTGELVMESL